MESSRCYVWIRIETTKAGSIHSYVYDIDKYILVSRILLLLIMHEMKKYLKTKKQNKTKERNQQRNQQDIKSSRLF